MKLPNFHDSWLSEIRKKIWADLINYTIIEWEPRVVEVIQISADSIKINYIDFLPEINSIFFFRIFFI